MKPLYPQLPTRKSYPTWAVTAYISGVAFIALFLIATLVRPTVRLDWAGLFAFVVIVLVVETLAIEFDARRSSISTSVVPLLGGTLLFGPVAAVLLSSMVTLVSWVRLRPPFNRMVFNLSNHLIGTLLCIGLLRISGITLTNLPPFAQFIGSMMAIGIVYLTTTYLLAFALSLDSNYAVKAIWKEHFQWLRPYYLAFGVVIFALVFSYDASGFIGILVILVPLLMLRFSQKQYVDNTQSMVRQLQLKNAELVAQAREINLLNEEMLLTLARSIDLRDPYVFEHSHNVARYAVLIAEELRLTPERIELIRKAGLLHDVGKLGIPESILFKPEALTAKEYIIVKAHAVIGADLIRGCHSLHSLIPIVRHHHEKYDGTGYPDGLIGEDIPLESRILTLADAVEAMASDRPYRQAMSTAEIVLEINDKMGTHFDPIVVQAFQQVIHKHGEAVIVNSARNVDTRQLNT